MTISEADYLQGELVSSEKHEYLGGVVYAMAGAANRRNAVAMSCLSALHSRLRGKPCRPWNSDTKVRVRLATGTRYYYPDAMVVCRPNPEGDTFQDEPVVIVEVLSDATRRIDEGEKKDAYLTIPSLAVYLLVEQDTPGVSLFQRKPTGFQREMVTGLDRSVALSEVGIELPLGEIYEGIAFEG